MDCPNAYLKDGVQFILCKKESMPIQNDHKSLFHATCPHQVFCQTANCHRMTADWIKCHKNAPIEPHAPARETQEPVPTPTPTAKKTRQRAKKG